MEEPDSEDQPLNQQDMLYMMIYSLREESQIAHAKLKTCVEDIRGACNKYLGVN